MFKLLLALSLLGSTLAAQTGYDGYKVFKVTPTTFEQIVSLRNLVNEDGVDFWDSLHHRTGPSTRIMVSPEKINFINYFLASLEVPYEIVVDNVET